MSTTPNLNLEQMPQNSTQPSVPYNDAMQVLDALLQSNVLDKDLTTPPATVVGDIGKRWLVPTGATGAWSGNATRIALCVGANLWRFIVPRPGFRVYVVDENIDYRFNGTAWVGLT